LFKPNVALFAAGYFMQIFLKSKIIMFFGLFGFLFSMVLCIFSGTSLLLILTKSIAGGIILGALGLGLEFFIQKTLSEEDYNSLFFKSADVSPREKMQGIDAAGTEEGYKPDHKIDLTEDAEQNTDALYQDMYKNTPAGVQAGSKSGDSDGDSYNEDAIPKNENTGVTDSSPDYTPPSAIHEDLSRLSEVNKEEKIKKDTHINAISHSGQDSKVSFKLKNKVINADPEIVAKAIKTILHRE
jgi:hypothetical protein